MKTKEELIKESYGEYWELVKSFVDENGWLYECNIIVKLRDNLITFCDFTLLKYSEVGNFPMFYYRPKSLQGIEDNNGWIYSNEKLPSKFGFYHIEVENNQQNLIAYFNLEYKKWYTGDVIFNVIKWQPINYPKKSLY
jgi:hypothetical protein